MSNRKLIERAYDCFAAGDAGGLAALFADDVVWRSAEGHPLAEDGVPWVGPDEVLERLLGRGGSLWTSFRVDVERLDEGGPDLVVGRGRYRGVRARSGAVLDAQVCHVWTLADGRITAFEQYTDTAQLQRVIGPL